MAWRRVVPAAVLLVLAAACARDKKPAAEAPPATSTSVVPSPTGSGTTSAPPGVPTSSTAPPGSSTPGTATTTPPAGVVGEALGWRIEVAQPRSGTTIGPLAVLCYTLTGTDREPDAQLEVALLLSGSTPSSKTVTVRASVGKASARVDLTGVPPGRYDLRVRMIVNGVQLISGTATVRDVTLTISQPEGACAQ